MKNSLLISLRCYIKAPYGKREKGNLQRHQESLKDAGQQRELVWSGTCASAYSHAQCPGVCCGHSQVVRSRAMVSESWPRQGRVMRDEDMGFPWAQGNPQTSCLSTLWSRPWLSSTWARRMLCAGSLGVVFLFSLQCCCQAYSICCYKESDLCYHLISVWSPASNWTLQFQFSICRAGIIALHLRVVKGEVAIVTSTMFQKWK